MFLIAETINEALRSAAVLGEEMLTMACVAFLQRCWDIWAYSAKRSDRFASDSNRYNHAWIVAQTPGVLLKNQDEFTVCSVFKKLNKQKENTVLIQFGLSLFDSLFVFF